MKLILLLLFCSMSFAFEKENEIFVGSMTYHFFDFNGKAQRFENKESEDGMLISNPMLGYLRHKPYGKDKILSQGAVLFEDSIGSPALGIFQSNVKRYHGVLDGGFFYGFYLINGDKWDQVKMRVPLSFKIVGSTWFVPMLGLRLSHSLRVSKRYNVRLNTLISPTLATLNIGFSWKDH